MDFRHYSRPTSPLQPQYPHKLYWSKLIIYKYKVNVNEKEVRKIANWPTYHHFCAENHKFLKMDGRRCSRPDSLLSPQSPYKRYWSTLIIYLWKDTMNEKEVRKIENSPIYRQFRGRNHPKILWNGSFELFSTRFYDSTIANLQLRLFIPDKTLINE